MKTNCLDNKKPLTLEDVAREIGVSRSTVSAAFTGNGNITAARRDTVRNAAIKLGYRPNPYAQRLANGDQDNTIALVTSYLALDMATHKLQILQKLFIERGYSAPVHAFGDMVISETINPAIVIRSLRHLRPLAIVCDSRGLNKAARDELKYFCEEGGRMVCYDVPIDLECDKVIFDREHNCYIAMRHLLDLGHREIGFFLPPDDPSRIAGVRRALEEFKLPMDPAWINAPRKGVFEECGAHLAAYFLAQKKKPTAMCIVNDNIALGFVAALQRQGLRVPEDVSVVSHNDTTAAQWGGNVQLTAASQPTETIACQIADLLFDRLTGNYDGPPRTVKIRGELAVRESTAPYV